MADVDENGIKPSSGCTRIKNASLRQPAQESRQVRTCCADLPLARAPVGQSLEEVHARQTVKTAA